MYIFRLFSGDKASMEYLAALLFTLAFTSVTVAYPEGAPSQACSDMFPSGHNANAQDSEAPYTISVSSRSYANNANSKSTKTNICSQRSR